MSIRRSTTEFQRKWVREVGPLPVSTEVRILLNEVAERLAGSTIWPPGVAREIAISIAKVVDEVTTIPEALVPEAPVPTVPVKLGAEQSNETQEATKPGDSDAA